MGGYMINGCGTADSYYKLKELPHLKCKSCRDKTYALMELRRKIRVLYIPTVTTKVRYAVVCNSCKNGYYVSEEQKEYILNNPAEVVQMAEDGLVIKGIRAAKPEVQFDPPQPEAPKVAESGAMRCACGGQLQPGDVFCPYCGTRIQPSVQKPETKAYEERPVDVVYEPPVTEEKPPVVVQEEKKVVSSMTQDNDSSNKGKTYVIPNVRSRKVCPSCRMMFPPDKHTCTICGSALIEK